MEHCRASSPFSSRTAPCAPTAPSGAKPTASIRSTPQLNQRVVTRLEMQYPTVFPECRLNDGVPYPGWIKATIAGLRHYGVRSMKSFCSNFEVEGEAKRPRINSLFSP